MLPLAQALVLQSSGPAPRDTVVSFTTGAPRVILLLHPPPGSLVFAELHFAAGAFGPEVGRTVQVELHPRPGLYGLDVRTSLPIRAESFITFKYPRYFSAPIRARQRYGTDVAYERALVIGLLQDDSVLTLLPSTRPAADNLRAPLPRAGTYLAAAPQ